MRRIIIGYLCSDKKLGKDEKIFLKLAKKKKIRLEFFNISKEFREEELEDKIKKCDLFFNSTAEDFAVEFSKMIEELGKVVIDSPEEYFRAEDKWVFFLKCQQHKIPTPETILLSESKKIARKELKKFKRWPVVLKRVWGTMGEYVEKADDIQQAMKVIKKFWKKGSEKMPIIAQEFINSPSYRVTVIGNKIVQTAIKQNNGWKATGVYAKNFKKFKIDPKLEKIVKKIVRISRIKICGIDLFKKNGKWLVLEVNSQPSFDFFEDEREMLIDKALNLLKKEAREIHKKPFY